MILIIDDDSAVRSSLSFMLKRAGYEVQTVPGPREAMEVVRSVAPDLILMDMNFTLSTTGEEGLTLLKQVKIFRPETPVILMTAWGSIQLAVQGMQAGAFDFITKPWNNAALLQRIETALQLSGTPQEPTQEQSDSFDRSHIIGRSQGLMDVLNTIARIAKTNASVLITGESGTGKELIAEAIHINSQRVKYPFVKVNLGGISQSLFESEMFGHKAGSFTGALKDKKGLFEEAHNGTIFLDEIGEMAFELQAKLLRILETGEYIKIGDTKPTRVNVRIIAATNRNLQEEIKEGCFREDLFYRLSVFQVHLPALRERAGDISILAAAFAKSFSEKLSYSISEMTPAFLEALEKQSWKGNIRELRNVIERSLIVCEGGRLDICDLPLEIQNTHYECSDDSAEGFELAAMERRHIARVLEYTKGNKTETARLLKIGLTTLYRKIEEYKI